MGEAQFRNAMEAIRHLSDASPPWDDLLQGAKNIVGADAATLMMFDQGKDLLLLKQTGIDESVELRIHRILLQARRFRPNCSFRSARAMVG